MNNYTNIKTKEIILREESEYPKMFTFYEERYYGILFYNPNEKDSYDSNHAIIYPDKITNLNVVLNDIKSFYANMGYDEIVIYHPFVPNYFIINQSIFTDHGFIVNVEENHRIMILKGKNTITAQSKLLIKKLSKWDERVLTDILAPDNKSYEQSVLKNSFNSSNFYFFVGYIDNKAVVEVNFHVSELGCTRFDHIVTAPDERGKGYAREIMSYIADYCLEKNFPLCFQWPDNATSERITTAVGFQYAFDIESGYAICKL